MDHARPLPAYLIRRFHGWRATTYAENRAWYKRLAEDGQRPRAMVISCCDSRVHVTSIFGADQGEFFIHRNIANLVPPYNPDNEYHGTSAAIEFAVAELKVAHLIVLGHSNCGGVNRCHDICRGHMPVTTTASFVGRWMDILRPGYDRVKDIPDDTERRIALEKQAVLVSMENLMTFPFVKAAVDAEEMTLHGLWTDTGGGELRHYDSAAGDFVEV